MQLGGRVIRWHPQHTRVSLLRCPLCSLIRRFGTLFAQMSEIAEIRGAALFPLKPH